MKSPIERQPAESKDTLPLRGEGNQFKKIPQSEYTHYQVIKPIEAKLHKWVNLND